MKDWSSHLEATEHDGGGYEEMFYQTLSSSPGKFITFQSIRGTTGLMWGTSLVSYTGLALRLRDLHSTL